MAAPFVGLSLRRLCAPVGGLALLGLTASALAAPTPDPPPLPSPDPPATVARTQAPAPAAASRAVPRAAPAPARATTVAVTVAPARTAPPAVRPKPAPRPRPAAPAPVLHVPHDRAPVPLAAFVPEVHLLDSRLLAVGGTFLLLAVLGGAIVLLAAHRHLAAVAVLSLAVAAPVTGTEPPVSYTLVGTAGTNGWFTSNVTVRWTVNAADLIDSDCPLADQITAEGVSTRQCTSRFTWGTVISPPEPLVIRIDKTAPIGVTGVLTRSPDSGGWYNRPVVATFTGQDVVSGLAGCSSPTYSGGDGAAVVLYGTCSDAAGNTNSAPVALRYDATPPTVAAAPDRVPDREGWYRKPVTVSFTGADATSGLAGCTEAKRYAGPDRAPVEIAGECRDAAGNVASQRLELRYDATAPAVAAARARVERGAARVTWKRPADAAAIEIERRPGVNGRAATIVYQGRGEVFVDRTVKPGSVYRYEIRAFDAAGNVGRLAVSTAPAGLLLRPAAGAVVRGRVTLAWQAVAGARFYNVQLYRGGTKVLSLWPKGAALRLPAAWVYAGKRQRLAPGLYRWYVWPARGTRERPTYGRVLGSSTFRVGR